MRASGRPAAVVAEDPRRAGPAAAGAAVQPGPDRRRPAPVGPGQRTADRPARRRPAQDDHGQRREDDQGPAAGAVVPRGRPPGDPDRVGASTGSPGTGSPGPSTGSTPCPSPSHPGTPTRCSPSCGARAWTCTCPSAARRPATTTRWPSRCWSRTARSCTATRTWSPRSTTSTSSPPLAASLGLTVPDAHRISDPRQVEDFDFSAAAPAVHPQEHPLRPGPPARPDHAAAAVPGRDGGVRPVQADLGGHAVDHAGPRPRARVLHAQHRAGRPGPGVLLLRVLGVPGQLRDGRQARDRGVGPGLRGAAEADRPVQLRLHPGRRRAGVRDRVQPAHPLGHHDVLQPSRPGPRLSRRRRPRHRAGARQPADVLDLPRGLAAADRAGERASPGSRSSLAARTRSSTGPTRCRS